MTTDTPQSELGQAQSSAPDVYDATAASKITRPHKPYIKRDTLTRGGKVLWSFIGVLATFGSALGLYQFVMSGKAQSDQTNQLLIAMVSEGVISEDQASRLVSVLAGKSNDLGDSGADALEAAVNAKDGATILAMAKMFDEDTRREGLELMKVKATTSEDWLEIAQISFVQDPETALDATQRAISLDSQNFRAFTLLSQIQAVQGDYATAKQSAVAAKMFANTTLKQVEAAKAVMNVATMGGNTEEIKAAKLELEAARQAYAPTVARAEINGPIAPRAIDDHPVWIDSVILQVLASAESGLENYDRAGELAEEALSGFERFDGQVETLAVNSLTRRKINTLNQISAAYRAQEKYGEAADIQKSVLDLWNTMADKGDQSAIEYLPVAWMIYGQALIQAEQVQAGYEAYQAAEKLSKAELARNPDDEDARAGYEVMQVATLAAKRMVKADDAYYASVERFIQDRQADIRKNPDKLELAASYQTLMRAFMIGEAQHEDANTDWVRGLMISSPEFARALEREYAPSRITRALLVDLILTNGELEQHGFENHNAAAKFYKSGLSELELLSALPPLSGDDAESSWNQPGIMKLGIHYRLSSLEADGNLEAAKQGLALARQLDAAGQLDTRYQIYLQLFADRISELETG